VLTGDSQDRVQDWSLEAVTKPVGGDADSLETAIIDFVVQSHFEFISNQGYWQEESGMKSALQRQTELQEKKRRLQRQAFQAKMQQHALTIAGTVLAVALSSAINAALQRRAARR
jgi:tRNA U34 5-methylaminomethyl-2-thiouridine-forming methyltransferase MnmC